MGSSSSKESRAAAAGSRPSSVRQPAASDPSSHSHSAADGPSLPHSSSRSSRRHDVSFFSLAGIADGTAAEPRRETKQERDARRAERDRVARLRERERSLKEEGVDGGYLVTLGTYTGPEDFSKPTVRQLMIERRVAPFWKGLNDHSESWTEHQLVAAARGKPIPAPDEIPPEEPPTPTAPTPETSSKPVAVRGHPSSQNPNDYSSTFFSFNVSQSHPSSSGNSSTPPTSPLFRGRARTLASLTSKIDSESELTLPEIKLPHQPQINGQPIEAYLYKDVLECPICFLYYPPYLNRTRCCDQPICSECFVQIKRPDPHPPEHLDPNSPPPPEPVRPEEEGMLISEPAACPFCVQTDFGVTYEPPAFRRGLAYPNQASTSSHISPPRSTPLNGPPMSRRRGQSVSASDSAVITTDRVRPDWAKKLADARAHAARRAAAATALHTAAYMTGNNGGPDARMAFARRRRYLVNSDTPGSSEDGTPGTSEGTQIPNMETLMAALEGQSSARGRRQTASDLPPARFSSRGNRMDELEELMMMEAIRLSLAAEEERKKKEEKETAKDTKKEDKKKAKEQKKAEKAARKNMPYSSSSTNASSVLAGPSTPTSGPAADIGKGKEKAPTASDAAPGLKTLGFNILNEPTSTLNTELGKGSSSPESDAQRHLEQSRANLDTVDNSPSSAQQTSTLQTPKTRLRQLSDASSSSSSFVESPLGSVRHELTGSTSSYNPSPNTSGQHLPCGPQPQQETPTQGSSSGSGGGAPSLGTDSMFNFGSLAAMIGGIEDKSNGADANPTSTNTDGSTSLPPV